MVLDIKDLYPHATIYGIDTNENIWIRQLSWVLLMKFADLMHADFVIVSVPVDVALTVVGGNRRANDCF
jgi:prephenate dehydrogenase